MEDVLLHILHPDAFRPIKSCLKIGNEWLRHRVMNDIVHAELDRNLANLAIKHKVPTKAKELHHPILGRTASLSLTHKR